VSGDIFMACRGNAKFSHSLTGCGAGPGRRAGAGAVTTLWGRVYPGRRRQADATNEKPAPLAGIKPAPQGAEPGPGRRVGAGAVTTCVGPGLSRPTAPGRCHKREASTAGRHKAGPA